jgi:hypothetical protein
MGGEVCMNNVYKVVKGQLFKLVYARFIRKNGRIIYPKNASVFKFWVKVDKV